MERPSVLFRISSVIFGCQKYVEKGYIEMTKKNYLKTLKSALGRFILHYCLAIHIESGNLFYKNFNINEHFYSFLLAQQDETKAIIPKRIAYHYSFEKYVKNYLLPFSVEHVEKFDLYANRNSKYLLYKFKD